MTAKIIAKIKRYDNNIGTLDVNNRLWNLCAVHSRFRDYITVHDNGVLVFESVEGLVQLCKVGKWMEYFGINSLATDKKQW